MKKYIILLSLCSMLFVGGCKKQAVNGTPSVVGGEASSVVGGEAYITTKSNSELSNSIVYRYTIVSPVYDTFIQVKKVAWSGGGEPTYTVVLGVGSANGLVVIDTEAYWGKSLKPTYSGQQYYEDINVSFGDKRLFLSGVEIIFKNKYELLLLNLPQNPIYIDFKYNDPEKQAENTCVFTLPNEIWQDALHYIVYAKGD